MATLKANYDRQADVLYIPLGAEDDETEGEEVSPGVMLMFDGGNRLVGIEITSASKKLTDDTIDKLRLVADELDTVEIERRALLNER